ncbi:unnamed protein product [Rotaria sp. Silwood2]|nr:unnamed protein product [Rotaria sp. Silwood2]
MIKDSSQFSSKLNENNFENIDSKELRHAIHNIMTNSSDHDNSTMNISTPNVSPHHLGNDRIISAIDLKSSQYLSPSNGQQQADKILSRKQTTSVIQSPTNSTSDIGQQKLQTQSFISKFLQRSPSVNSQYNNQVQHTLIDNTGERNNWIKKLRRKLSNKHLNTRSFDDLSPKHISHINVNDQNNIDVNHLHMREAMAVLEQDLTKEAFQALINKKKDSQQNSFMRILTGPSRCCRSYRTQRRLATVVQRSIDIAIKDVPMSPINNNMQSFNYQKSTNQTSSHKNDSFINSKNNSYNIYAKLPLIHAANTCLEKNFHNNSPLKPHQYKRRNRL